MTDDTPEWGPWIEHDGSGFPRALVGLWVRCEALGHVGTVLRDEGVVTLQGLGHHHLRAWDWRWYGRVDPSGKFCYAKVLRYRIRRPRGAAVLTALIADLPAPRQLEEVDA